MKHLAPLILAALLGACAAAEPQPPAQLLQTVYVTQATPSACSLASVTMVVNALRRGAGQPPVTQAEVLGAVGDPEWSRATAMDGDGVSFAALQRYLRQALERYGFGTATMAVFQPADDSAASLAALRRVLASDGAIELAAFDQGTLTGSEHVGHVSPLGPYDPAGRRLLVLDVDPEQPAPYWASDTALLAALVRPDPTDPTGNGVIRVVPPQETSSAGPGALAGLPKNSSPFLQ
ncbi:MAG: phytochelatin synthase family protein [Actinomycetota bacterium]